MGKIFTALGIAVSAAVPVAVPSSLEALMIVPCLREVREVRIQQDEKWITVKKGETLSEISKREYGTAQAYGALAITNGIKDPDKIRVGEYLRVYTGKPAGMYVRDKWLIEDLCPITARGAPPRIVYVD